MSRLAKTENRYRFSCGNLARRKAKTEHGEQEWSEPEYRLEPCSGCLATTVGQSGSGPFVFVSGTTVIDEQGAAYACRNRHDQSICVFERIRSVLQEMGAGVEHVVRIRAYLTDIARGAEAYLRTHGEVFRGVRPVAMGVEARLIMLGMMVKSRSIPWFAIPGEIPSAQQHSFVKTIVLRNGSAS